MPRMTSGDTAGQQQHAGSVRTALLLLAWASVAAGIALKDGRYGAFAFALVLLGCACAVAAASRAMGRLSAPRPTRVAYGVVALLVGLGPLWWHPAYDASGWLLPLSDVLAAAAGLLAAATVLAVPTPSGSPEGRQPRRSGVAPVRCLLAGPWPFRVALTLACAAGLAMIGAAPSPRIDVFAVLQGSTRGLAHGADMYRQRWDGPGELFAVNDLRSVYPYLPGTSVLLAPFRLLFGDVRYGLVAALAVAAVLARRLAVVSPRGAGQTGGWPAAPPAAAPALLPLLVVVFPKASYALQQSWTEPLLVAALAGMVWAMAAGHGRLAVCCLAAALASKQHVVLLLPVAACWPAFGPRRALAAAGAAALAVAPWVVADPGAFWHDAVRTNLDYPVLDHSLSVPGFAHHFGVTLGFGPFLLAVAAAWALAWRVRGDGAGFCLGAALVVLAVDLMNKQTFFNHYTLALGLIVLALAAAPGPAAPSGGASGAVSTPVAERPAERVDQRVVEKRSSDAPSIGGLRRST